MSEPVEDDDKRLIPIRTIDGADDGDPAAQGPVVPKALADDPVSGDGSSAREGVQMNTWRVHRLNGDRLGSVAEPEGNDRRSRKARKARNKSRRARTERGRKIRRRARVVVALLVVVAVVGVAYAGITYSFEQWGGKTVPYVVGLSEQNATAAMEEKGFTVTTESVPSDAVDGHVVSVEPAEGTRVDEKSVIHLQVGHNRTIPEVVGMGRDEATATLEAAGANNIRYEPRVSDEEEGKVLEVRPGAGAVFMSSDEVTLVTSQLLRMIDVVGEEEAIAMQHLQDQGIAANSTFEQTDAEHRLKVVRTEPAAGEALEGEATVFVGDPLTEVAHLADYYDAKAPHIKEFLEANGYEARVGTDLGGGHIAAGFVGPEDVVIGFTPEPWSHAIALDKGGYNDVMNDTAKIEGVRMVIPIKQQGSGTTSVMGIDNPTVSESTARDVMNVCGLSNLLDSCTQTNITVPKGTKVQGHVFCSCYGESDNDVWCILIKGTSSNNRVVANEICVSCVPKATYRAMDLSPYGGSVCDFVAYTDELT